MIHWLAFLATALIWGSSFLLIKLALEDFAPITLVAVRVTIGLAFLVIYGKLRALPFPPERRFWLGGAGIGVLSTALPFFAISWGEQFIESGIASVLNSTTPLFSLLLAPFIHRADRLPALQTVGVVIGFTGVLVVVSGDGVSGALAGKLGVMVGALSYAMSGLLLSRFLRGYHFVSVITIATGSAVVITWIASILTGEMSLGGASTLSWGSVIGLGLFGTGAAYALFMQLIRAWGPTRASMITYAIPPVGVLLGTLIRDEPLTWKLLLGGVLIAAGVIVANRRERAASSPPAATAVARTCLP